VTVVRIAATTVVTVARTAATTVATSPPLVPVHEAVSLRGPETEDRDDSEQRRCLS
jgi:hypothetical protein